MNNSSLHIVTVTYGNPEMTLRCLKSVVEDARNEWSTITVVDNNSPDGTPDQISQEYPEIRLIRNQTNAGFSKANNIALTSLPDDNAPVLLLNPDCIINGPALQAAKEAMNSDARIGVLGIRLLTADGELDHAAKRRIPSAHQAMAYFAAQLLPLKEPSQYTAPDVDPLGTAEVDAVNGAFMLIRREAMAQVGLLDERYWMYGEDLDWCVRFKRAGWKVLYKGDLAAVHLKGGTSNKRRSLKLNYEFHRSMSIFYRDHLAPDANLLVNMAVMIGIWTRFAAIQVINSLRSWTNK